VPEDELHPIRGNSTPFVDNIKYLGFVCDRRMAWELHI
jgi:hypothetical protein